MIKVFLKDSFLYTLSNILTKGIGFLMLPIYTSFFSPKEFGVLDMLLITGNILSIIIGLEIHQAVARFFPEAPDHIEKRRIVSTAFWIILGTYVAFLIPAYFFAGFFSIHFFKEVGHESLIRIALISYGFNFLYYFASNQLRWQMKTKENVFVSLLYSGLSALGAYFLLKKSNLGVSSVFLAQIAGAVIGLITSVYLAKDYYRAILDKATLQRMLAFSIPLIFSTLTIYAMLYVDRIMINSMLKSEDLGYYAFAYRVASVVSLVTIGVQSALTPLVYNNFNNSDCAKQIANLFHIFLICSALLLLILFTLSPYIVLLIASDKYLGASPLIPWVAISMLFTGVTNFTPGIFIEKKTHLILYINITSFLLNLVIGYCFIKLFGLIGAVSATSICSIAYFSMYYFIGQKYYFIPFFWTKIKQQKLEI